jgi:flagellar motor switch protein FliG
VTTDALPVPVAGAPAMLPAPRQRAAALVLAIGSGNAAAILDHLTAAEVALLADEVASLGDVDPRLRTSLMNETMRHMMSIDPAAEAQMLHARSKAMAAAAEMADLAFDPTQPFKFLQKVELDHAVQFLKQEHPQTAAVILSAQPAELAAKILSSFEGPEAGDIALRIATIGRTPPELIHRIEEAMRKRLTEAEDDVIASFDGPRELAAILNNAERDMETVVLEHIAGQDSELAERVRSLMFVFEDVVTLEDRAIQQVLQQVATAQLALALKGASDAVRDCLLRNLSERARESLVEEMDLLGSVRRTDVAEARSAVIATIRALEAAGTIVIARGADGDYIE